MVQDISWETGGPRRAPEAAVRTVRRSIYEHRESLHRRRRLRSSRVPWPRHYQVGDAVQQHILLGLSRRRRQAARADRVPGHGTGYGGVGEVTALGRRHPGQYIEEGKEGEQV